MLTFWENRKKLILAIRDTQNQFFAIILKDKRFKAYVAS